MNISDSISNSIKKVAAVYFPNAELYLFGSRARGDNAIDSDYDVLLMVEHSLRIKEKMEFKKRIRIDLLKIGIRADVLIQSKDEVVEKSQLPGHIIKTIMNEAEVL